MTVHAHERAAPPRAPGPELRLLEAKRRVARLHLLTYIVGNACFWILWGALSISADHWYWWPLVPVAAWTVVLVLHLRSAGVLGRRHDGGRVR